MSKPFLYKNSIIRESLFESMQEFRDFITMNINFIEGDFIPSKPSYIWNDDTFGEITNTHIKVHIRSLSGTITQQEGSSLADPFIIPLLED